MNGQKNRKMAKLALWVFIIMIISFSVAGAIVAANRDRFTEFSGNIEAFFERGEILNGVDIDTSISESSAGIMKIRIEDTSSVITIRTYEGTEVTARFYGKVSAANENIMPKLESEISGSTVIVKIVRNKRAFWFGQAFENTKLDVFIPADYAGDLEVDAVSSDVDVSGLKNEKLRIDTVSGRITAAGVSYTEALFETVSGAVTLTGETGKTDIESVSGNVTVNSLAIGGDMDISTTSGKVDLLLPKDGAGFRISFSSVSGRARNDFPGIDIRKSDGNRFDGTYGDGEYMIDVGTVSGNLDIQ